MPGRAVVRQKAYLHHIMGASDANCDMHYQSAAWQRPVKRERRRTQTVPLKEDMSWESLHHKKTPL